MAFRMFSAHATVSSHASWVQGMEYVVPSLKKFQDRESTRPYFSMTGME